ncbi:MAG: DUF342 domain-containing protein [Rhodocyclales bacterium]|nr:DUF342 domain-containing protein [Rhodocyclales bacterium]
MVTPKETHPAVPATAPRSSKGTVASLSAGEVLLPDFVRRDADGVFVQPDVPGRAVQMQRFVDRVFGSGSLFVGLDCDALAMLLYGAELAPAERGKPVRIAAGIEAFDQERRELYKSPKPVDGGARVEYLFAPVWLERSVEVPIFGDNGENGQPLLTGYEKQLRQTPTRLNLDEFVAAMWLCGVRSGIDVGAVRAAIDSAQGERVDIARRSDPQPGTDATVREQTLALHRDDSPAILPSGKIDLGQFKNHFPQVAEGTRLLQKMPRRLGLPGRDIDGAVLEPELPRDFELEDLAGPGTRVERNAKGEFLLAARDGFLNIDKSSQQISVTEKIVNREGVSQRTTGNLFLVGEHYEEHGEVQEHRSVEGHHMKFRADVFGGIVSHGGDLHLCANLAGGSVRNQNGSLRIDGRASRAVIDARGCEVQAAYVESSSIVAGKLKLGRAIACDIVAEEVEIDEAIACSIAARRIHILRAGSRREVDTLVSLCLPDFSALDKQRDEAKQAVAELQARLRERQAGLDALLALPELRNYLAAEQRIRAGGVALSPTQEAQWRQATQRVARPLQEIQFQRKQLEAAQAALAEREAQLAALDTQREQAGSVSACAVDQVVGSVAVQAISVPPELPVLAEVEPKKLRHVLRDPRLVKSRLFHGESGRYTWTPPAKET